jgi:hypothetical protein
MKRWTISAVFVATFSVLALILAGCGDQNSVINDQVAAADDPTAADPPPVTLEWPRVFQDGALTLSIYQPQIDRWDGLTLNARTAVSVRPSGAGAETFGIVDISATTDVDKTARTVTLRNVSITKAGFPTAPDRELAYLALLRNHVPAVRVISLDHFEASYAMAQTVQNVRSVDVVNSVPRIIFSSTQALLVLVDGQPVFKPVPGSPALYVENTSTLILKYGDRLYLTTLDRWYEANTIEGPWNVSPNAPVAAFSIAKMALLNAKKPIDILQTPAETTAPAMPLAVYVSTVPAEIIQTQGKPDYELITGTQLLSVKNSNNAIFLDIASNEFYVLISGRWFKTSTLEFGPWQYVPARQLPSDFARIPSDNPHANVLVSIPGTPEAQEAVIATSIPQTAAVSRTQASADVQYDGSPKSASIQLSLELEYAVNTSTPVIHVIGQGFYCVQNGVWFTSTSAYGPWAVTDYVPPVIYTIPPSCPVYYATYVRVYDSSADVVYVGYAPGYLGAYVSPENVVVYGTGYIYDPYVGTFWVGTPSTYGYGAGFADGFDVGFSFGFSAGVEFGLWPEPWWGAIGWGWRHGHHFHYHSLNHVSIYDHWEGHGVTSHNRNAIGPGGVSSRAAEPFNPYNSRRAKGSTGRPNETRTPPREAIRPATPAAPKSNVYAGHDGQVYRHDGTQWQRSTPQGWSNAERERGFQQQRQQLQNEQRSRASGQQRYEANHPTQAPPAHSGGGGGSHGGHREQDKL